MKKFVLAEIELNSFVTKMDIQKEKNIQGGTSVPGGINCSDTNVQIVCTANC